MKAQHTFITWAYWTLGVFCFGWLAKASVAVTRFYQQTDLPLFGACATSEVIVYSLLVLLVPLAALHLLTYAFQKLRTPSGKRDGFPGVVGDQPIPATLGTLRILLFLMLVFVPSFLYAHLAVRCIKDLKIVWKPTWAEGKGTLEGWQKLTPASPPDGIKGWIFAPDWRWQHKYIEWQQIQETKTVITVDDKTNARTASASVSEANIPVLVTAWPGLQPAVYVLAALGFVLSSLWLLYRGLRL